MIPGSRFSSLAPNARLRLLSRFRCSASVWSLQAKKTQQRASMARVAGTQDSIRRPNRPPRVLRDGRPAPVEVQWKSHLDATRISHARHLHTTGMFFNSAIFSPKNAALGAENAAPENGIMLDTQEVTDETLYSGGRIKPLKICFQDREADL